MSSNNHFFEMLDFATKNPKTYACYAEWTNFLRTTPFYEMEKGLSEYFGCSISQVNAWVSWSRELALSRRDIDNQAVKDKFAKAQRVTWDTGSLPARFDWALNEDVIRTEEQLINNLYN